MQLAGYQDRLTTVAPRVVLRVLLTYAGYDWGFCWTQLCLEWSRRRMSLYSVGECVWGRVGVGRVGRCFRAERSVVYLRCCFWRRFGLDHVGSRRRWRVRLDYVGRYDRWSIESDHVREWSRCRSTTILLSIRAKHTWSRSRGRRRKTRE